MWVYSLQIKRMGCKRIIGLGKSGSIVWCPILAFIHRVIALHHDDVKPTTPLHTYKMHDKWWGITASHITSLHTSAQVMGTQYGIEAQDILA